MRTLSRLWQALERIPGLAAVPAEWRSHCGDEYPVIEPHLRPTADIGATYPCPHPRNADCPRRIVEHADGSFSAACRHPHQLCDDLVLSPKEALVHTLDVVTFVRPVAEALAVRTSHPSSQLLVSGELESHQAVGLATNPRFCLRSTAPQTSASLCVI
jgi:hypothetical protein